MLKNLLGSKDDKKLQPDDWELIGTRFFGEEDFEDVSPWVQQQIKQICEKGLGETPEELTHHFEGKVFAYRLDFDGLNGEILGVYRRQKSTLSQPNKSKSATPTTGPIYRFHRPEKWSDWVHDNVANIRKKPVPAGADNTVVHYLKGTHYRYKLDFPVVKNWGKPSLGTPIIYRKQRTWYWKKSQSSPQWQYIGMCYYPHGELTSLPIPKWVRKQIKHLYEKNNGYSRTYLLKGKRYRYRLEFKTYSHANHELYVYKIPRRWYWKKLNK